jgi:hypothetical protein
MESAKNKPYPELGGEGGGVWVANRRVREWEKEKERKDTCWKMETSKEIKTWTLPNTLANFSVPIQTSTNRKQGELFSILIQRKNRFHQT